VQIGNSASGTVALLTLACGEYAVRKSSVFEWHRRFKEGWEDAQDDPGSGQSKIHGTEANVDRIQTLVRSDRSLGVRLTAEELDTGICLEEKTQTLA
jgi:hypothetical protein